MAFEGAGDGLAARLSAEVREQVCPGGSLRLRTPAHEAVLEVLRHLAGPLVLAPAPGGEEGGPGALEGSQVLQAAGEAVDLVVDDGPSPYRQACTVVLVNGSAWDVLQPGLLSVEVLRQQSACLVVFVCTGNTCRSPLAEALLKQRLAEQRGCSVEELPGQGFLVQSAGLAAMMGAPAAAEAIEVAHRYGADLTGHHSQPLTAELAAQADYLVAMTQAHLRALGEHYPRLGVRPRLLNPEGDDLADPIGQSQAVYEECGQQIWRHLDALLTEIQR